MSLPVSIVVAVAENGVIGRDNKLIWRLKSDLRRFRDLTWGKPIVMGRKTFESIGRALPGRETVVLTQGSPIPAEHVHTASSWEDAVGQANHLAAAMGAAEIPVVGGSAVFELALPHAARIHLTLVHAEPEGDVLMPPYDRAAFRETLRQHHRKSADDECDFTFIDLERRA